MSRWESPRWDARESHVKRNFGAIERWIRVVAGFLLTLLGVALPMLFWGEKEAETIGLLAVVIGAAGYYPLRHL